MRTPVLLSIALQAALAQAPQTAEAHLERGAALHRAGDYAKAIPELRRALELRPGLTQAHGMLGEALFARGFAAEAEPHLARAGYLYLHALALLATNRTPQAIRELLEVHERRPDDPDVLFHLGKAAGEIMQQSFGRLMRLHPGSPHAFELHGQSMLGQRREDLAEPALRKALELQPDRPGVRTALGRLLAGRGDLDGAEKLLRAEAAAMPGNAETAWRLGAVLLQKGRGAEALAELQRSDRLKPNMVEPMLDLGRAWVMVNQLEPARETFLRILAIDDRSDLAAAAHLQLSQVCRKLGRAEEAALHLKRFRELSPKPGAAPK